MDESCGQINCIKDLMAGFKHLQFNKIIIQTETSCISMCFLYALTIHVDSTGFINSKS